MISPNIKPFKWRIISADFRTLGEGYEDSLLKAVRKARKIAKNLIARNIVFYLNATPYNGEKLIIVRNDACASPPNVYKTLFQHPKLEEFYSRVMNLPLPTLKKREQTENNEN